MISPSISVAVEGDSDEVLARKLADLAGFNVGNVYVQRGKNRLDQKLVAFNNAAQYAPWFILRDLDEDAGCAPELVRTLLPTCAATMCFRISVRAAEAWFLADRKSISQFLGVPLNKITVGPDTLTHPKTEIANLARKSRKKQIRDDMTPGPNGTANVGPAYVTRLIEFASDLWNPHEAANHSQSLATCIAALERLKETLS
jgi:hypothetical protein